MNSINPAQIIPSCWLGRFSILHEGTSANLKFVDGGAHTQTLTFKNSKAWFMLDAFAKVHRSAGTNWHNTRKTRPIDTMCPRREFLIQRALQFGIILVSSSSSWFCLGSCPCRKHNSALNSKASWPKEESW